MIVRIAQHIKPSMTYSFESLSSLAQELFFHDTTLSRQERIQNLQSQPETQYLLGQKLEEAGQLKEAETWYEKAALQDHVDSQFALGAVFYIQHDFEKTFFCFQKAAQQEHTKAQKNLGSLYYNGLGIARDLEKALYWLNAAATQGDLQAKEHITAIRAEREQEDDL